MRKERGRRKEGVRSVPRSHSTTYSILFSFSAAEIELTQTNRSHFRSPLIFRASADLGIAAYGCEPEAHKRKAGEDHKNWKKRRQPSHPQHIHHNLGHLNNICFLSQELCLNTSPYNTPHKPYMVAYMQPQNSGGQGFKVLLSYISSVRLPWVILDLVSKENERIWIFKGVLPFLAFGNVLMYFTRCKCGSFLTKAG